MRKPDSAHDRAILELYEAGFSQRQIARLLAGQGLQPGSQPGVLYALKRARGEPRRRTKRQEQEDE